jgi:hypothetical protein
MHCLEKVKCITNISHVLGLAKSAVHTIYINFDIIKGSVKIGTKMNARTTCYSRSSTMDCKKNFEYLVLGTE